MEKEQKKRLKALYKKNQQDAILNAIPMDIDTLKALFVFLNRACVPECDHTLRITRQFLAGCGLNVPAVIAWLADHGGFCDCEVLSNVYDDVGDIVGWHLDNLDKADL